MHFVWESWESLEFFHPASPSGGSSGPCQVSDVGTGWDTVGGIPAPVLSVQLPKIAFPFAWMGPQAPALVSPVPHSAPGASF